MTYLSYASVILVEDSFVDLLSVALLFLLVARSFVLAPVANLRIYLFIGVASLAYSAWVIWYVFRHP